MATVITVVSLLALIAFFAYWLRKALLLPETGYTLRSQEKNTLIELEGEEFAFFGSAGSIELLPINSDKELESSTFIKAVNDMIASNFSEVLSGD